MQGGGGDGAEVVVVVDEGFLGAGGAAGDIELTRADDAVGAGHVDADYLQIPVRIERGRGGGVVQFQRGTEGVDPLAVVLGGAGAVHGVELKLHHARARGVVVELTADSGAAGGLGHPAGFVEAGPFHGPGGAAAGAGQKISVRVVFRHLGGVYFRLAADEAVRMICAWPPSCSFARRTCS